MEMRIFIDKFWLEVIVIDRRAIVAADMDGHTGSGFHACRWGAPTMVEREEI